MPVSARGAELHQRSERAYSVWWQCRHHGPVHIYKDMSSRIESIPGPMRARY
jgi:hypothetical protein